MAKLKKEPDNFSPKVKFLKTKEFSNVDSRRSIFGTAGDLGFPLQIRQIKVIEFTKESQKKKMVVGNHRHFGESGQWEVIVVLGSGKKPIFHFRYRNSKGPVKEKMLKAGDVVLIPPGCSLALVALQADAKLIEISNQEYSKMNYMDDKLF